MSSTIKALNQESYVTFTHQSSNLKVSLCFGKGVSLSVQHFVEPVSLGLGLQNMNNKQGVMSR